MDEKKAYDTVSKATQYNSSNYANYSQSDAAQSGAVQSGAAQSETSETTSNPVYTLSDPERVRAINDMFDANANAQRTALQESGDQALSDAQANRDKIAQTYQTQRNMAAVNWERQRRNFMEGANISGVNTGAGSQAELHMMGQHQRDQNTLGYQQAQAEIAADRNIADIQRQTQAAINEAVAKNDYQRAAALLSEYNEIYNRALKKAESLAQFGDFSGYGGIYGNEAAENMRNNWIAQNPDLAYAMGLIDETRRNEIREMMGSSYGGGGGGAFRTNAADEMRKQFNSIRNDNSGYWSDAAKTEAASQIAKINY